MSVEIEIDPIRCLVIVRVSGWMSDDELLEGDDRLRERPDFRPHYGQLVDLTATKGSTVTRAGIERLTARPPLFDSDTRRAITANTDLEFGMARMFELNREGKAGEIRVFRTLAEATEWLADE